MATRPDDVLGWSNTRWGMGYSELIETIGAERLERLVPKANRFCVPAADEAKLYCELRVPNLVIGDTTFRAMLMTFEDLDGQPRLREVALMNYDDFNDVRVTRSHIALVRRVLTEKYGKPERLDSSDRSYWRFPTTTITLAYDLPFALEIWFEPSDRFRAPSPAL